MRAALLALALVFVLALPACTPGLEEGIAAYERGDYETAHRGFLKAAEQGNAAAQYWLGWMYDKGYGVPENDSEAIRWYRKAAEQGLSAAQNRLGVMHYNGEGVTKDYAETVRWFRESAEQGDVLAQNRLGVMHYNGEGVTKDYAEAVRWFHKAAEQGNAMAQRNLGFMYRNGRGVPKDDAEAARWYRKAAEQGLAVAQHWIGALYRDGKGVSRDYIEAYKWFNLAAARGEEGAATARDNLQRFMYPSQIAQAQARSNEWQQSFDAHGNQQHGATPKMAAPKQETIRRPDSSGSGFLVSDEGHILTNDHVIADCVRLRVLPGGVEVRARDSANDLALLQGTAHNARPALLRKGRALLGETVVVAGYPLRGLVGDGLNVTRGEVSALSGLGGDSRHLQITAPVQPGNSGGPLLDESGHVLGVVTSKLNAIRAARITGDIPQNVNFAIRVESARTFLDAHNIPYKTARFANARSTEQIAAEARAYTVLIECWE